MIKLAMNAIMLVSALVMGLLEDRAGLPPETQGPLVHSTLVVGAVEPFDSGSSPTTAPTTTKVQAISTPVSYGDERRWPMPAPTLPPHRKSAPDWRCDEWMPLAREVGWPEEELPQLSYVIYRESRCRPDQHNPDDPMGGSNGLVQINQFWCKPTRYWPDGWLQTHGTLTHCDDLFIPEVNLRSALAIWGNSGWSPWFP